jgi:hypothetical protein
MTLRTLGYVAIALVVAFGTGWCSGASGRRAVASELAQTAIRADISDVRAAVLDARFSLAASNFGDARRALQGAVVVTTRLQTRLTDAGFDDRAGLVDQVRQLLEDADRRSGALDAGAADVADRALRTLESSVPITNQ